MNIDATTGHSGRARNFEALRSYDREPVSEDYVLIRDVMVPMRDDVRLATDVYLPAKDGRSLSGMAVAPITIDLWMTGNRFVKGHRVCLDISSSNFPNFDPNPNTGEPIGYHTHTRVALNVVYHDKQRPSRLLLPIRKV